MFLHIYFFFIFYFVTHYVNFIHRLNLNRVRSTAAVQIHPMIEQFLADIGSCLV